ncbi:MAG: hypothetical protein KatS3mg124_1755 [Porticoccaceae bacterium]|nr:MAG: hypothetical protein KatS3mg124_1755 [Porticoccaceae bacterium]
MCLRIANDCPPLEAEVWSRLGERFFTPSPGGGVGLGLSIARRVAELHGARLVLKPWRDGAGFVAEVVFPA